jgi:hypothetical protein
MTMQPVISSNLVSVGYEPSSQTLRIRFNNGTYDYFDVPSDIHNGLMNASSKGGYHAKYIKNKYRYKQL